MKILSYRDLASRGIPYSKAHLWRLERAGKFPKRVSLTPRCYGWPEHEIDAWLKEKIAERDSLNGEAA